MFRTGRGVLTGSALTLVVVMVLAVVAGACGGGDDGGGDDGGTAGDDTASSSSTTSEPADDPTSTTSTTTTSTLPPCEPESIAPDGIHDVVVAWADGTGDPLALAEQVIGFPLPVPVADGSTPKDVSVRLFDRDQGEAHVWEWVYEAFAAGPVGDVDISLDDNGPGSVELRETYDRIMGDLGWSYSNSTGSDPGERGGPNSINHVYVADEGELTIRCDLLATTRPMFVWLDEDLVFGDEENPGYRVDVPLELPDGTIPVPLLRTLTDALPGTDGAELVGARLHSLDRPADSFDAAEGLRYLDAEVTWRLAGGSPTAVQDAVLTGLDGEVVQPGEESFFDEGTIEVAEPTSFDGDWQLPVIVAGRYEGTIEVAEADGDVVVTVEVRMEPERELLAPPGD